MQRRNFMSQMSAGVAGAGLAACGGGNAGGTGSKPTFVFVHGAWHGGWCWSETVRLLAEKGYPALALDLPGHGITARFPASYLAQPQNTAALSTEVSPLAALTLNDYRDHVLKVIRGLTQDGSGPVILVGHSLGGATLSAVAEAAPQLIRRLVYLTAFVPVAFQTVIEYLLQPNFASSEVPPLFVADPTVVGASRINHDSADGGYVARDKSAFYHDVSDAAFPAVANLLTPDEPIQAFTTPVGATAARWGSVPRAFIRCTGDRAIPIAVQDKMIADADAFTPGNAFVQKTLATSHSPFVSNPSALVDALVSVA
ncbi:alpha/beta hydrolase [Ramlibacter sp. WS9]|uniref:alpha/beta hydrolase n=1 Tax=Ramlibacter sp. WS9 TaxID=1882741 RepID=UPI0011450770|nr:alpha/beta fold hydrolase [Ramlibacter sp. WS9]ROZ77678.1 alpha/beta fold hydrolase [Ramlibacter sp. WS9]